MRVQVDPQRVEVAENLPFTVQVTVTNTGTVIGGYHLRVLGADPSWVTLEAENLSLFPESSQSVAVTVAIPPGVGAGDRRIAVQVRELTPPQAIAVAEIELVVPAREAMRMALSPLTVLCGKHGRFSVVAENTGNTAISMVPVGMDPEDKIRFQFIPEVLDLAPGEHVITDLRTSARRRWFGSPVVRPFGIAAMSVEEAAAAAAARNAPPAPSPDPTGVTQVPEPPPPPPEPLAQGTMMQKPKLGRGLLSLLSLLLAVTVFAVVITIALSRLVGVSAADRDLAIQVASARSAGAGGSGSSALGGSVKLLTDGSPAAGVAVEVFASGDLTQAIISTATNDKGAWAVTALSSGSYKIRFRGAGFAEVWYPNALTGADAKEVQLEVGQKVTDLQVALGGLPASITGKVVGADVAGSVLTVQVPQDFLKPVDKGGAVGAGGGGGPGATGTVTAQPVPSTGAANAAASSSPPGLRMPGAAPDPTGDAGTGSDAGATGAGSSGAGTAGDVGSDGGVLRTIPIASDGMFTLNDLPSPGVFDLIVSKPGYATDVQRVDLSGGESRTGIVLVLRTGDGLISGSVVGPDGPLGNAVITASNGPTTVRTLSLTKGTVGEFTLRGLVTPATYTVTVTLPGYTTVTSTLSLASGQKLTGVLLSLSQAAGSLSGVVTTLSDSAPAPGVTVTITSGSATTLTTVTQSGEHAGAWTAANLPIPGTYTVTFSRSDLQSQTVAVALNSAGQLTSGAGASGGIDVAMRSAFAVVQGTVTQQTGNGTDPVGEATISLASGTQTYVVTSASTPAGELGHYQVGQVEPGTYTLSASSKGTSPTTVIITVSAGQVLTYDPVLIQPASVSGTVTSGGVPLPGTEVDLYLTTQYPATVYRSTTTGPDGSYSFPGVDAPQAYVVEARNTTTGPLGSGTIVLAASQAGVLNLEVGSSAPVTTTSSTTTAAPTTPSTSGTTSPNPATGTTGTTDTTASTETSSSSSSDPNSPTVGAGSGEPNPGAGTAGETLDPRAPTIHDGISWQTTDNSGMETTVLTATATGVPDQMDATWLYSDDGSTWTQVAAPAPAMTSGGIATATLVIDSAHYGHYKVRFSNGTAPDATSAPAAVVACVPGDTCGVGS
jgi:5-hydroxyisourate hydrolase-like protein (transthyretin family)